MAVPVVGTPVLAELLAVPRIITEGMDIKGRLTWAHLGDWGLGLEPKGKTRMKG